jgi:hypothetical protein
LLSEIVIYPLLAVTDGNNYITRQGKEKSYKTKKLAFI